MARKRYGLTESRIARFLKEGRGQGTKEHYKPFFTVGDVPSRGRLHRIYCVLTNRIHHLLSDCEYYAFLSLWWNDDVYDIREQFPLLDRRETMEIAALNGFRHPRDRNSQTVWVMTTDFLVTMQQSSTTRLIAYAVKYSSDLSNKRTLELLEIERQYWARRDVPWRLLTEQQVKSVFTKNLSWVLNPVGSADVSRWRPGLDLDVIAREISIERRSHLQMPIRLLCRTVDQKHGYATGSALAALRYLLGIKRISVDLSLRHLQDLPAEAFLFRGA